VGERRRRGGGELDLERQSLSRAGPKRTSLLFSSPSSLQRGKMCGGRGGVRLGGKAAELHLRAAGKDPKLIVNG